MANFQTLQLTTKGLQLLAKVQGGADTLTFTKTEIGDGVLFGHVFEMTELVSSKAILAITEGKLLANDTYQVGAYFNNSEITTGFWWREIGVFAKGKDGIEVLYAYSNAGDSGDYIPIGSDERIEKYIYQSFAVGNATRVSAQIDSSKLFIPIMEKGEPMGVTPLGADGKVDKVYLPDMNYVKTSGDTMTGAIHFESNGTPDSQDYYAISKDRTNINGDTSHKHTVTFGSSSYNGAATIEHKTDGVVDGRLEVGADVLEYMRSFGAEGSQRYKIYGEHYKPTPNDIGAMPKTTFIDGKDVLGITADGWYYGTTTKNVPTTNNSGYIRVVAYTANYRVVYWRPYDSVKEYVNVLKSGTWLGWSEIFTSKGGTLTGNLNIFKASLPVLELDTIKSVAQIYKNASDTFEDGLILRDCDSTNVNQNSLFLRLNHYLSKTDLSSALRLSTLVNEQATFYKVFGEHNKPAGTYTGTGTSMGRTIDIGGTGKFILIQSNYHTGIVGEYGGIVWKYDHSTDPDTTVTTAAYAADHMYFKNGKLWFSGTLGNVHLNDYYTYNYYVL